MRRLICAFVVRIGIKQVFSWRGSIITRLMFWESRAMRLFACEPKTVWSQNMGYVDLFIFSLCLCHVMRSSVNFLPFVWFQWNCWCFENHFHTNSHFTVLKHFPLTHISLASHFWDIGKQCRPRSDATERGIWSGSSLFANRNIYSK